MSLLTENFATVVESFNQSVAPILSSTKVSGAVYVPVPRFDNSVTIDILSSDYIVIGTAFATTYFNLPDPAANPGRSLTLRNNSNYNVYSTEENVAIPGCGERYSSTGDQLIDGDYQGWVDIVSDGQYWVIVRGYNQAYCD